GFTATARTSASAAAAALSTTRTPYRSASSAPRSGRRAVASRRPAGQPERSSPDSSTSPIFPAPITATVCIAVSSPETSPETAAAPGQPGAAAGTSRTEEHLGLGVPLQRYGLQFPGRLDQRYPHDVRRAQRDHLAEVALVYRVDRVQPEPRRQYPVERAR